MDSSKIGLDFIVENPEYIRKLASALDTQNITVKKQVFELLSALCVHNEEGKMRTLDTLEHFKKLKGERYRLTSIVRELEQATSVGYQTALVAFINCLIISTSRLSDRIRLRNEFIGCHLLPVLNGLRKCAEAEPELAVQLDVFDEQRDSDDSQSLQGPHGVDLNSPLDVFYAILKQVAETPHEVPFLLLLQHLLRIDQKEPISDVVWDTAERLVHRATLLESRDEASRLLNAQSRFFCACARASTTGGGGVTVAATPPPPPPPPLVVPPPPPPPFVAPPPPKVQVHAPVQPERLPQQAIPAPRTKMKTINWNKIPSNKVFGKNNIWTQVAYSHQHSPTADIDWSEMEGLFCQQAPPSADSSPKLGAERRIKKESPEVALLDGKRSLNVNIFLKQFRSSNNDIIRLIREGEHDDIGAEKLKGLLKILPEVDELDILKGYNGEFDKLGTAEKFLIQLTGLSNYKLRIESMLLKEEFASNMGYLEPSINSMILAAQDLTTNKPLQEVLYMILIAGNFLNCGGYAGGAAGVKLSSLQKITDIRANKPNMNLIHFVALQAEKRNRNLLSFTDHVGTLEDAAKTTVEQLHNEINALDARIKKIKKQIETPTTEEEIKYQMVEFLQMAEREVSSLQVNLVKLEHVRRQLADFFCEDPNSFKLEECFRIFHGLYSKFRQAVAENERRRALEEQAAGRRRQREELLAAKRKQMESMSDDGFSIDMQIYAYPRKSGPMRKMGVPQYNQSGSGGAAYEDDPPPSSSSIPSSPSFSRRRLGSFNNGLVGVATERGEERSPDVTPNGSLRRRRSSRVLSEDDEGNLMEFLRATGGGGGEGNRERKSWGSLDRSWARKARGNSPRKRPALLSADFTSDRERPSSPSPLSETRPVLSAPEEEMKPKEPKEWKQKIESWLQANESDQNSDEQRRQRRLANRKSTEMDSEGERSSTLDTLPEGKQVYSGGQSNYRKTFLAWTPSLEGTDVVGAMEVVEEVQPAQIKDKSAWRKSNLNVANTTEQVKEPWSHNLGSNLGSIDEDKPAAPGDRKELISSLGERMPTDRLTLYIRKPEGNLKTTSSGAAPPPRRSRDPQNGHHHHHEASASSKADIDQDNVETPPTTRRTFVPTPVDRREPTAPSPCSRRLREELQEETSVLGDGQFDRYSAARRTRRYKRPQDTAADEPEKAQPQDAQQPQVQQEAKRRHRNHTGIDPGDVGLALKINSEREEVEERTGNVTVKVPSNKIDIPTIVHRKPSREPHDNDEGFEESQSLMSESPSQGASDSLESNRSAKKIQPVPVEKPPTTTKPIKPKQQQPPATIQKSNSRSSISSTASTVRRVPSRPTTATATVQPPRPRPQPATNRTVSRRTSTASVNRQPVQRVSSFMKPTASSVTKQNTVVVVGVNKTQPFRTK